MKPLILLLVCSLLDIVESQRCIDENGEEVDWYIVYKFPKSPHSEGTSFFHQGLGFIQFSSLNYKDGFKISKLSIADPNSAPGRTLNPLYSKSGMRDTLSIFYNDEHPNGTTSFTHGHTKGVMAVGMKTGFWLIHSVPKFPPAPSHNGHYDYPATGHTYGQTMMCITFDSQSNANNFAIQLFFNYPYIYYHNIPSFGKKYFPDMVEAALGKHHSNQDSDTYRSINFMSEAGNHFKSFAKFTNFNKDLYADLVAPEMASSLIVQSWPNGPGRMPSRCLGKYHVQNVGGITYKMTYTPFLSHGIYDNFTAHHDHSKWTYGTDIERPFICVGDINRAESQKKRAGGTVCLLGNSWAYDNFAQLLWWAETCPLNQNKLVFSHEITA